MKESEIKKSVEDPILAKFLKSSLDIVVPDLTNLMNKSLFEGSMEGLKWPEIVPLLEKVVLGTEENKNYKQANDMVFWNKITQRVVEEQLDDYITRLHNNILLGFDKNLAIVLIFLDLSAAFYTRDFDKLIQILHNEIGVDGIAPEWFRSCLTHRTQQVKDEYLKVP